MTQNWTDDVYDKDAFTAHSIMSNIELMFATLKSTFSGTSQPSNAVAGMLWLDTTVSAELLKMRNEDNDDWIVLFDLANLALVIDTINEATTNAGVTIDGVILKDNIVEVGSGGAVKTDTIVEKTPDTGVSIDGLLIKDAEITGQVIMDNSLTLDKIADRAIMLPFTLGSTGDILSVPDNSYATIASQRIHIPYGNIRIRMNMLMYYPTETGERLLYCRFSVDGNNSNAGTQLDGIAEAWHLDPILDVSALEGWYDLEIQAYVTGVGPGQIKEFAFAWELN